MEFDIATLMMVFFVIFLVISMWKVYAFLPNKQLADDDTTKESQEMLLKLVLEVIKESDGELDNTQLFQKIKENEGFDEKRFWRFNQNRLNQLLHYYHLDNPHTQTIKDIYKDLHT